MRKESAEQAIATNRKAYRDYSILGQVECGIVLEGSEVKSLREGRLSLVDSFARCDEGALYLYKLQILPYTQANQMNHDIVRKRKLLLHKREIQKLIIELDHKGRTLIPLKIYFKRQWAKVLLGLAVGKKQYDKREDIKKRSIDRDIRQAMKKRM